MTAIIRFKPLCGINENEPLCYLLEIDETKLLLDCGWTTRFDVNDLANLKEYIQGISGVLLSHPDLTHLGAIPYAMAKLGLKAPVYATVPTCKMGQMFMYDAYLAKNEEEDFETFNLDDVDNAFDQIQQLKYQQRAFIKEIEVTPLVAGHLIGGAIWRIKKETEEIIYAVDFNHKKEGHLRGTVLETISRPTLLITDAYNILNKSIAKKERDNNFIDTIMKTLRNGGDVLLPVDTAGRILELLLLLDQYWIANKIQEFTLAAITHVCFNTVDFAKSQLEWMSESVMRAFNNNRENQFAFKHVKICHDIETLDSFSSPKVILASMPDLDFGFSRKLFVEKFASNPKNVVLFTDDVHPWSLAHNLIQSNPGKLSLDIKKRVPLSGEELNKYLEEQEQKKKEKEELKSQSDSESEDEEIVKTAFKKTYDMTAQQFVEQGFKYPMFPLVEQHKMYDEYGEIFNQADFDIEMIDRANSSKEEEEEEGEEDNMETEEQLPIPTKIITSSIDVEVKCSINVIPFRGRSDGWSIKTILQHVAPRKLIVVHGADKAIESLRQHVVENMSHLCKEVLCPKINEEVNVTSDTNIYKVKLKDSLLSTIDFQKVNDYEIGYVNARITFAAGESEGMTREDVPMLEEIPFEEAEGHKTIHVGETKLSDFKTVLTNDGYKADFSSGGVLVTCNGNLALKKEQTEGEPTIRMQGVLSKDYFKVRNKLYQQFTIV